MQQPIRLALVGAGIFARDAHVPSLLRLNDQIQIAAIYSRTATTAEQLAQQIPYPVRIFTDYVALLGDPAVDALDIVLPIPVMTPFVEQALASGKHLISEKPIATDLATAQRLIQSYIRRSSQVWMVGENWRYESAFVRAAELVQAGEIGRPVTCQFAVYTPMLPGVNKYANSAWRRSGEVTGGHLLDAGVHHMAALRLILGEIERVSAVTRPVSPTLPPADTLSAHLQFANGALGVYLTSYAVGAPWPPYLSIVGDQGALRVLRGEIEVTSQGNTRTLACPKFDGVEQELAAFAAAIRQGTVPRNTPEAACQDLAVIEALLQSAVSAQSVKVKSVIGNQ
jgi:predicted dehydrogenase